MKNQLFLLTLCLALFGASSCSEDDDTDGSDLTTGIVGSYTNTATNTNIVVNKVDDTTVSISLTTGSGSGEYDIAFASTTMNTETSFTLNTVVEQQTGCNGIHTWDGTGTYSSGNISLFMTRVASSTSGGIGACEGSQNFNVSASK